MITTPLSLASSSHVSQVQPFDRPRIELEQYPTGAHLASRVLYTADMTFGDIQDAHVVDLGCGAGVLSIGAALLGAG